jgi:hypothetical protein
VNYRATCEMRSKGNASGGRDRARKALPASRILLLTHPYTEHTPSPNDGRSPAPQDTERDVASSNVRSQQQPRLPLANYLDLPFGDASQLTIMVCQAMAVVPPEVTGS